jgi:short-subunit dehydrogenase
MSLSFGRAIGHELRGTGVTITTLCPGPTTSEFAEVANMQMAIKSSQLTLPFHVGFSAT